jgi:hypothetical protein
MSVSVVLKLKIELCYYKLMILARLLSLWICIPLCWDILVSLFFDWEDSSHASESNWMYLCLEGLKPPRFGDSWSNEGPA